MTPYGNSSFGKKVSRSKKSKPRVKKSKAGKKRKR